MSYVALTPLDLALAASLLLINAGLSIAFRLGLERTIAIAAIRMVAQLALAGIVLKWVFAQASPWWTVLLGAVMIAIAGHEIVARQQRRIEGPWPYLLGSGTLLTVGVAGTLFAVVGVIGPDPWHAPRYILPILGMVLGNALTGVSLVLDTLTSTAWRERTQIEARLSLGATRFVAMSDVMRSSLKTGMMPIINSMAATGVVALPGMMTGQILSGVDPVEATKYQVMIMFLIAGTTGLAVLAGAFGGILLITDKRDRLRLDRIEMNG